MNRKIFIDGGARIGESIEWFLERRKDLHGCDVYLFEPDASHQEALKELCCKKGAYNFSIASRALWTQDTQLELYLCTDTWGDAGNTLLDHKKCRLDRDNPMKIQAIDTAEFIMTEFSPDDYIVLKLDVEGAEYYIVPRLIESGAIKYLDELYIEWHDESFEGTATDVETARRLLAESAKKLDLVVREWDY